MKKSKPTISSIMAKKSNPKKSGMKKSGKKKSNKPSGVMIVGDELAGSSSKKQFNVKVSYNYTSGKGNKKQIQRGNRFVSVFDTKARFNFNDYKTQILMNLECEYDYEVDEGSIRFILEEIDIPEEAFVDTKVGSSVSVRGGRVIVGKSGGKARCRMNRCEIMFDNLEDPFTNSGMCVFEGIYEKYKNTTGLKKFFNPSASEVRKNGLDTDNKKKMFVFKQMRKVVSDGNCDYVKVDYFTEGLCCDDIIYLQLRIIRTGKCN